MNVFVTGGDGYIGRNIIRALVQAGHHVKALSPTIQSGEVVEKLGANIIAGDFSDSKILRNGMRDCAVVIHCIGTETRWGNPLDFHRLNIASTQHLISACQATHRPRLIFISTNEVIADGKPKIYVDESVPRPRKPIGLYSLTKGLAERYVTSANSESLQTIIIRASLLWGRDDPIVLPELIKAVQKNRWLWVNQGHQLVSTSHIDNLVEGVLLSLEQGTGGNIYFLTDGAPVELRNFITNLLKTQKMTLPDRNIPRWVAIWIARLSEFVIRRFELDRDPVLTRGQVALLGHEMTFNDQKARDELGYQGKMTLEEGMADLARRSRKQPIGVN